MTILVRDEVDIIEANIRTHAKLGVDGFVALWITTLVTAQDADY